MASKDEAHKFELKSRDETCAAALNIAEEAVSARQKLQAEWESLRVKVEADVGNAKEMKFKEEKSKWESDAQAAETRHEQALAQKNSELQSAAAKWMSEKSVMQTQLLQHVASVSTLQQQLAGVNEEIEELTECMEDSNVKLNDKDEEIQRLGQALDTATQMKQEMQVLLMEMDSEITSLKAQLQANGVPAAGRVVPRTRVTAAQVIFADVVFLLLLLS